MCKSKAGRGNKAGRRQVAHLAKSPQKQSAPSPGESALREVRLGYYHIDPHTGNPTDLIIAHPEGESQLLVISRFAVPSRGAWLPVVACNG